MAWLPGLIAAGFAMGCLAHTTGLLLLARGVELYGPGYPAWRHAVMAAVDVLIVAVAVGRPRWLLLVLPLFLAEQLAVNGVGLTPAFVLVAWALVVAQAVSTRRYMP